MLHPKGKTPVVTQSIFENSRNPALKSIGLYPYHTKRDTITKEQRTATNEFETSVRESLRRASFMALHHAAGRV